MTVITGSMQHNTGTTIDARCATDGSTTCYGNSRWTVSFVQVFDSALSNGTIAMLMQLPFSLK